MLSQERLPPSARDFEVYEAVILVGQTTREAATQFGLSQTRICQLVERVRHWQAEVLPADAPHSDEHLLRLARCVAAGRLDHLYSEMMEAWRKSQGEVRKTRSSRYGDEVTTTATSYGDPKYLLAAMRLTKSQAELGAWGGLALLPVEEEEAASPPAGDCSATSDARPVAAENVPPTQGANSRPIATSRELAPRDASARRELFAPVQQVAGAAAGGPATTQIQVTPENIGLSVEEILGRQERRALKRSRRAG